MKHRSQSRLNYIYSDLSLGERELLGVLVARRMLHVEQLDTKRHMLPSEQLVARELAVWCDKVWLCATAAGDAVLKYAGVV